jgi:hypothetical protein
VHDGTTLAGRTICANTTLTAVSWARCDSAPGLAGSSASVASAARTNPGAELMIEVFRLAGPSVILLDARQLDDARLSVGLSGFFLRGKIADACEPKSARGNSTP